MTRRWQPKAANKLYAVWLQRLYRKHAHGLAKKALPTPKGCVVFFVSLHLSTVHRKLNLSKKHIGFEYKTYWILFSWYIKYIKFLNIWFEFKIHKIQDLIISPAFSVCDLSRRYLCRLFWELRCFSTSYAQSVKWFCLKFLI